MGKSPSNTLHQIRSPKRHSRGAAASGNSLCVYLCSMLVPRFSCAFYVCGCCMSRWLLHVNMTPAEWVHLLDYSTPSPRHPLPFCLGQPENRQWRHLNGLNGWHLLLLTHIGATESHFWREYCGEIYRDSLSISKLLPTRDMIWFVRDITLSQGKKNAIRNVCGFRVGYAGWPEMSTNKQNNCRVGDWTCAVSKL